MPRAHPRSRGENPSRTSPRRSSPGSSPLTRGKQAGGGFDLTRGGLIPAHAGKTRLHYTSGTMYRAHPRSRGENRNWPATQPLARGSSPLTRGKLIQTLLRRKLQRLIPAHAGKTREAGTSRMPSRAHPRSRGENGGGWWDVQLGRGSSPLTRGKPLLPTCGIASMRLIPAHAGKTKYSTPSGRRCAAHPRSRGENRVCHYQVSGRAGSSPLTRGKPDRVRRAGPARGLIPAHAGKTSCWARRPLSLWAHPRSRGENGSAISSTLGPTGSSPLTRGKR